MEIEKGVIVYGSAIDGEVFPFFNVGRDSNGYYNWGAIPYSPLINHKSKRKPMEFISEQVITTNTPGLVYSRRTRLNDEQRWSVNYGNNIYAFNNAVEAIRAVAGGSYGSYNRPSSWFRVADLWGYDQNQQYWMEYSTNITSVNQGGVVALNLNDSELSELFLLKAAKDVSSNMDAWNFGFLMSSSFSSTQPNVHFLCLSDMRSPETQLSSIIGSGKITFNTKNINIGKWVMYPCITTALFSQNSFTQIKDEATDYQWLPYPFANQVTINIVSSGGQDDVAEKVILDSFYANIELYSPNDFTFRLPEFSIDLKNESDASYEATIKWKISNAIRGSEFNVPSTQNGFKTTIGAKQTQTILLATSKDEDSIYRFNVGEPPPQVYIEWTISREGQLYTNSETIDLDKY